MALQFGAREMRFVGGAVVGLLVGFAVSQAWMEDDRTNRLTTTRDAFERKIVFGVYAGVANKDTVYDTNAKMQKAVDAAFSLVAEGDIELARNELDSTVRVLKWVSRIETSGKKKTIHSLETDGLYYVGTVSGRFTKPGEVSGTVSLAIKPDLLERMEKAGLELNLLADADLYHRNKERIVAPRLIRPGTSTLALAVVERCSFSTWLLWTIAYFLGGTIGGTLACFIALEVIASKLR